jgi:hypothetical protein
MSKICQFIYEILDHKYDDETSVRLECYTTKKLRFPNSFPMFLGQLLEYTLPINEKNITFIKVTKYKNGESEIILAMSKEEILDEL